MHQPMEDGLEGYLSGRAESEFEQHLTSCPACRAEAEAFREQADWMRTLRPPEDAAPAAGFYARVMERIEAQRQGSFWSFFMQPVLARRLVYASLTLMVLLGVAVWQTGADPALHESNPMQIMANSELPAADGADPSHDRSVVLANLASYGSDQSATLPVSSD